MASHTSASGAEMLREPGDFSLVLGGPLFQLLRRSHLSGDALELVRRRVITIPLLAWLPLLVLSALEGQALGGNVAVPFLLDVEAHARFLVALPLLIVAELVVLQPGTPRDNPGALAVDVGNRPLGLKSNGPRHTAGCIVVSCGPAIGQSKDACSAVLALRRG
jgi:hypothetical protein